MHKARAIEQDIHGPRRLRRRRNGRIIQHIKRRGGDAGASECRQQRRIAIRCHHARPFGSHGECCGAANALARCRYETKLARQSSRHDVFPSPGRAKCARFNPAP